MTTSEKVFLLLQQNSCNKGVSSREEHTVEQSTQKAMPKDAQRAFDRYSDMIYRLALIRTQKQVDAEDVVQDVFLRYIRSAPAVMEPEHEKAWLLRVAINCTKSLTTSAWKRNTLPLSCEIIAPQTTPGPSEVYMAVSKLPQKYRTVIHLFYYEGLRTSEIAELLSANDATVRSWLRRARESLRKTIEIEIEDGEE
jgi:RNA polymerase sigma-70 factor (ECF subfamily)